MDVALSKPECDVARSSRNHDISQLTRRSAQNASSHQTCLFHASGHRVGTRHGCGLSVGSALVRSCTGTKAAFGDCWVDHDGATWLVCGFACLDGAVSAAAMGTSPKTNQHCPCHCFAAHR